MSNDDLPALPALPEPDGPAYIITLGLGEYTVWDPCCTMDRVEAYGRQCYDAAVAQRDEQIAQMQIKVEALTRASVTHMRTAMDLAEKGERLIRALEFYAERNHFVLGDPDAWDTVSDEPQNHWCDEAGTATVEDGSIARAALDAVRAEAKS